MMPCGLLLYLLCFILLTCQAIILEHPQNLAVVEGHPSELCCEVENNMDTVEWHSYSSNKPVSTKTVRITDGYRNRYFLARNGNKHTLYINATMALDSGMYFCVSGVTKSRNATLRVLPQNWIPTCTSNPPSVSFEVGLNLDIMCISNGDMNTNLRWMRNNNVIKNTFWSVNGSSVTLEASITISDESEVYICEASLPEVQSSEICVLRPNKVTDAPSGAQYVAYVIVIVLSVVVVILFIIMIVVILRQRQCRYCQTLPPPPQTVLDMDQLQSGLGPGLTELNQANWDSSSIGSANDLQGFDPPPDVVPTVYRRGNLTQTSPTSTLRHNMDSVEPETEKPGVKTPKIQSLKRRSTEYRESRHHDEQPSTSGARNQNTGSFNDLGTLQKDRLYRKNKVVTQDKQKRDRALSDDSNTTNTSIDNISLNIKHEEHIL